MLVTDSSGSMQATDVKPTRLTAARNAAKGFVDRTPEKVDLSFITFSSAAQVLVPPTDDRDRVKESIDGLRPNGGTAIGSAIQSALATLRPVLEKNKGNEAKNARKRATPASDVLL